MKRCVFLLLGVLCLLTSPATIAREWTNKKGKKLEADFVRFKDYDTVILRRERDGKEYTIKVETLSRKDQSYISRKRSALGIKRKPDPEDPADDPDDDYEDDDDDYEDDNAASSSGEKEGGQSDGSTKSKANTTEQTKIITVIILVVVNIPLFLLFGKLMFRDMMDFMDCVKYTLTPNWLSWARGELQHDWFQSMKLSLFLIGCGALISGEFFLITMFFFN